jgi:hypothetical protein
MIDLIGDIHGHYQELQKILKILGYSYLKDELSHPENRKIGFVGDFINRGPQSVEVLTLVKSLCESGKAITVLGNHEFRLIQNSVAGKKIPREYKPFIPWLRTLPLFLELKTLRMVHAVWHFSSIELLRGKSVEDDSFIWDTLEKKSSYKLAVDRILSGIKISIPKELKLKDRFGVERTKGRLKWWKDLRGKPYAKCFLSPMFPAIEDKGPTDDEFHELQPYSKDERPVFIGHYCLPPTVPKVNGQVVCLDGCVTCDNTLWGYRHDGTESVDASNLIKATIASENN